LINDERSPVAFRAGAHVVACCRGAQRAPFGPAFRLNRTGSAVFDYATRSSSPHNRAFGPGLVLPSVSGGRRRSIRLPAHDYTTSAYLITLCTYRRAHSFGQIVDGVVHLNDVGRIVCDLWMNTPRIRPGVILDAFVVMPDHLHAILALPGSMERNLSPHLLPRSPWSLGALVAGYKSACTSTVNRMLGTTHFRLWQRNYHERVIRDGRALDRMRRYIEANPTGWWEKSGG